MQKPVPNNVEFNSVCNKKLIHELNVRDVFVLSKQEINAKKWTHLILGFAVEPYLNLHSSSGVVLKNRLFSP